MRMAGWFGWSATMLLALAWPAGLRAQGGPAAPTEGPEWLYPVQPGDTLVGITAQQLAPSIAWARLARHNRLAPPYRLAPGGYLRLPLAWLRHDPQAAEVIHLRGDVQRVVQGLALPLALGDRLRAGEVIQAGPQGLATLRFVDGSRLLLTPGSRLRVDSAGQHPDSRSVETRVHIDQGSAETQVNPKAAERRRFEITTPTVILGVRGTDFRTHASTDGSQVEVLSGRVAAGERVTVNAGFGAVARINVPMGGPLRLADAPDLSALPQRLAPGPLLLAWAAVPGAVAYRAQLFEDGPDGGLLLDARTLQASVQWPALPEGRYLLRLRVVDAEGLEGLDASQPLLIQTLPEPVPAPPPPPAAPPAAPPAEPPQVEAGGVRWRWQPGAAGLRYQVQAAHEASFQAPLLDYTVPGHQLLLPLTQPGRFALRLRALAADGRAGPFGAVQWVDVPPPAWSHLLSIGNLP